MQQNHDEPLLPGLQHLMLHESQADKIADSTTESSRYQREIRKTFSMDFTESPRRRVTSSTVFSLLNTDSSDVNRTPSRNQKMPPMLSRSCSPEDTPRASDVSRFGSMSNALPRNPIFGTSPVQPHHPRSDHSSSMFRRTDSIPSHLPPPPFLRKISDSVSDAESSTSEVWNPASGGMRRSFSTVSSASSVEDHDHTFRPPRPSYYSSDIHKGPRMTPPDLSPDSFFAPTYAEPPRTSANPTSSRAPISRTTKACNACRSRKVRCDAGGQAAALVGSEMPCTRCKDAGLTCVYSAQQRKRGPTPGSRRGDSARKLKLGESELASLSQSRRVSGLGGYRGSHLSEEDQLVSARSLNRPTPYRSLSVSTYHQDTPPSVLHSRAPPPSYPQHAYDYYSLQGESQPRRLSPPGNNSPPWSSSFTTASTASTSPNTPYLSHWAQMAPPPSKGHYSLFGQGEDPMGGQQRPSSLSVMGWAGAPSANSDGRKTSASRLSVAVHPYSGGHSRTLAEEEAFRNGYTMALEEIERQKGSAREAERDRARESSSLKLPPISIPVGPAA